MEHMTHEIRRQYWIDIVKRCNESGMKKKDWLKQNGINDKAFYNWQRKLRKEAYQMIQANKEDHPSPFVELKPPIQDTVSFRINNMEIEVASTIDNDFLLKLVTVISHVK